MLPTISGSCSVAAEIHTPKKNTIAIEETQKEMIPKTECPCRYIRYFTFILDLNKLKQPTVLEQLEYIFIK